ncbi:LADA_0G02476g1_1 [Lachancea dasiensis]|uniref:Mitochondrial pyruvate carrier n=1 Tax=Lachancea dasiensis TaxID=1072105 RepID=A0A1G4JR77_9SACH|nr:LADA_0G02476g1_1 [Lachancea dasiensis]
MSQPAQKAVTQSLVSRYVNKETLKYVFTTHFWGPVSNFGIPLAAIYDLKKDPELISGPMTTALILYSSVFMKFALTVQPKNYLLFGCHVVNSLAQTGQGFRFVNYHYLGGADAKTTDAAASKPAAPQ